MTKSPVSLTTKYQAGLNALPHGTSTSWHILWHLCADGAPAFPVPNYDGNWPLEHLFYLGPIRIHWFPSWHLPFCVLSTVTVPAWSTLIFPYNSHHPIPGFFFFSPMTWHLSRGQTLFNHNDWATPTWLFIVPQFTSWLSTRVLLCLFSALWPSDPFKRKLHQVILSSELSNGSPSFRE